MSTTPASLWHQDEAEFASVEGGPPRTFRARTPWLDVLLPGPYLEAALVPAARVRPAPRRD